MKKQVQTKMGYDPDFGLFGLWEYSGTPKKSMIEKWPRLFFYENAGIISICVTFMRPQLKSPRHYKIIH